MRIANFLPPLLSSSSDQAWNTEHICPDGSCDFLLWERRRCFCAFPEKYGNLIIPLVVEGDRCLPRCCDRSHQSATPSEDSRDERVRRTIMVPPKYCAKNLHIFDAAHRIISGARCVSGCFLVPFGERSPRQPGNKLGTMKKKFPCFFPPRVRT